MRKLVFGLSVLSVVAAGGAVWAGYQFLHTEFPDVAVLRHQFPVVHYQGKNRPPQVRLQKARPPQWVSIDQVSKGAIGAIIVSEDWAFYQHKGYDANQIKEAIQEDIAEGRFARGASTITQQVVKNVFLERDKNLWRKVKELLLAVRLEDKVGKRKILETYLNVAEWGEGVYGIGPAAQHYFQKSPAELSAKEGAFLAMLLPSPIRYGQSFRSKQLTQFATQSIRSILEKMTQAKYLTEEERITEQARRLSFELATPSGEGTPEAPPEGFEKSPSLESVDTPSLD